MRPPDTVRGIYDAFARGDVPAILATLADDVAWDADLEPSGVPYLEPRRGRDQVASFFFALHEAGEMRHFALTAVAFDPEARVVVALVDLDLFLRSTGRTVRERDEAHVWRFDEAGRITAFRHGVDTLKHQRAYAG